MTTIAAFLRISSIENERRHAAFTPLDLAELCAELFEFFLPLAQAKGVAHDLVAPEPVRRGGSRPDARSHRQSDRERPEIHAARRGGADPGQRARRTFELSRSATMAAAFRRPRQDIFRRFARASNGAELPGGGLGLASRRLSPACTPRAWRQGQYAWRAIHLGRTGAVKRRQGLNVGLPTNKWGNSALPRRVLTLVKHFCHKRRFSGWGEARRTGHDAF